MAVIRSEHAGRGGQPFRPVQYLGSKARLVDEIRRAVDEVAPARGPLLDISSGSGVVAETLGRDRDVTAVDSPRDRSRGSSP